MSPEEHREVFENALHKWLEAHGVEFKPFTGLFSPTLTADMDLNKLKVGMVMLIRAYGGDVD